MTGVSRTPVYKVTVIGGGTGSFNLLSGLRTYTELQIQSIVTMMDSGGDSGRLRDEFGVLPPGDVRRCLVALSEETKLLRDLFSFRFTEPPLENRSFGNLFFLALAKILSSEQEAIDAMGRILKIRGRVIAVTLDHVHICSELIDGTVIVGEANIDLPKHDASVPIKRVFLKPEASANPEALAAIHASDFIVLAPGNLYTSTIPNILVKGMADALQQASAPLIYVLNLMTIYGETYGYSASRHVAEIANYAGRVPDAVLLHRGRIPHELAQKYKAEAADQVKLDIDRLYEIGVKVVKTGSLMSTTSYVRHDPAHTAHALMQLMTELASRAAPQLRIEPYPRS